MNIIFYIAYHFVKPCHNNSNSCLRVFIYSILSVTSSIMICFIVSSMVYGFHEDIISKSKVINFDASIKYQPSNITYNKIFKVLNNKLNITNTIKYLNLDSLVIVNGKLNPILLKGFDKKFFLNNKKFQKQFYIQKNKRPIIIKKYNHIFVGDTFASENNIQVGDILKFIILNNNLFKITLKVQGIYTCSDYKYTDNIIFIDYNIFDSIKNINKEDITHYIGLYNIDKISRIKKVISKYLDTSKIDIPYNSFISVIDMEYQAMYLFFIIIFLVYSVSVFLSFNLFIIFNKYNITVLKMIGFNDKSLRYILYLIAITIFIISAILGITLAVLFLYNINSTIHLIEDCINYITYIYFSYLNIFDISSIFGVNIINKFYILNPDIFYDINFPFKINYTDIIYILIINLIVCLIAVYRCVKNIKSFDIASILKE